jgi:hypothetical protein
MFESGLKKSAFQKTSWSRKCVAAANRKEAFNFSDLKDAEL